MNNPDDITRKNRRTALTVLAVVVAMTGMAYASVPLYNLFCRVTGFGGTTQVSAQAPAPEEVLERTVAVRFDAGTARGMPWKFAPESRQVVVKLGAKSLTHYRAENPTDESITGTAIYNVTPDKVGKYFHKIECFCFGEQTLPAGKSVSMPVVFYVDPAMNADPGMDDVTHITLSYTFFRAGSSDLDKALKEFYNRSSAKAEGFQR